MFLVSLGYEAPRDLNWARDRPVGRAGGSRMTRDSRARRGHRSAMAPGVSLWQLCSMMIVSLWQFAPGEIPHLHDARGAFISLASRRSAERRAIRWATRWWRGPDDARLATRPASAAPSRRISVRLSGNPRLRIAPMRDVRSRSPTWRQPRHAASDPVSPERVGIIAP